MPRFLVEIQEVKPTKGGSGCLQLLLWGVAIVFALGILSALAQK